MSGGVASRAPAFAFDDGRGERNVSRSEGIPDIRRASRGLQCSRAGLPRPSAPERGTRVRGAQRRPVPSAGVPRAPIPAGSRLTFLTWSHVSHNSYELTCLAGSHVTVKQKNPLCTEARQKWP